MSIPPNNAIDCNIMNDFIINLVIDGILNPQEHIKQILSFFTNLLP